MFIKGVLAVYVFILSGSDGAFTRTPERSTLIPGTLLRLNCGTDLSAPVLWRFTPDGSSSADDMTSNGGLIPKYESYFHIDQASKYDLVAQTSNANESYCGMYECAENEGGGDSTTATVAIASSPNCVVDKPSATADESVTYTCSVMEVCGTIDVSLTIENNGTIVMTASNTVTWTVEAGNIVNSNITCLSTIQCPSVTIREETEKSSSFELLHIILIVIGVLILLGLLIACLACCYYLMRRNNKKKSTTGSRPRPLSRPQPRPRPLPRQTVVPYRADRVRGRNTRNDCSDSGSVHSAAVWTAREDPAPHQHQRGVDGYPHHAQQPGHGSHYYPSSYLG